MISPEGQPILSVQAKRGSLLGLPGAHQQPALLAHGHCPRRGESQLSGRDDFTALMQPNPVLALKILQVLAAEVRSARQALY